jgi:hypothetical protein
MQVHWRLELMGLVVLVISWLDRYVLNYFHLCFQFILLIVVLIDVELVALLLDVYSLLPSIMSRLTGSPI